MCLYYGNHAFCKPAANLAVCIQERVKIVRKRRGERKRKMGRGREKMGRGGEELLPFPASVMQCQAHMPSCAHWYLCTAACPNSFLLLPHSALGLAHLATRIYLACCALLHALPLYIAALGPAPSFCSGTLPGPPGRWTSARAAHCYVPC